MIPKALLTPPPWPLAAAALRTPQALLQLAQAADRFQQLHDASAPLRRLASTSIAIGRVAPAHPHPLIR